MPTEITGQNGALIKLTTHVGIQGCAAVLHSRETSLQKALKACQKKYKGNKHKKKRQACERAAHKKYDKKSSKSKKKKK